MSHNLKQCYDLLNKTSRSFGITIDYLDEQLREAMCVYYLVQRAVDAVEDDMTIPDDTKLTMLTSFDKYLLDPTWRYTESNDEYAVVLENFPCITLGIRELPKKYSDIILEFGTQIAQRMTRFVGREFTSIEDVNEYCRKVTSHNGMGIMELFVAGRLEFQRQDTALMEDSFIIMQKTNLIRDFSKDWRSGRLYYPRDVWSKYVSNPGNFLKPENFDKGVECVNELVTDSLQYLIPYLRFLETLRSPGALKFFGIHQVMAIATLERCYNNPRVFMESVTIGREETSEIISSESSLGDIIGKVQFYMQKILDRSRLARGTTHSTQEICRHILAHIEQLLTRYRS